MVNFSTLSSLFLSLFISNADVNTDLSTAAPADVNVIAASNGGVLIDDLSTEIWSWWDSNPENWERKWDSENEILVVKCKNVGKDYDTFGRQFDPLDFSKTPVIKLRMKYEGETAPKVRIDVKDYDGKTTNGHEVVKTLKSGDWTTYYYHISKWEQGWPNKDVVDPIEIVEMLVFVNPGGPDWSGTIYLDDVHAIPASEMPKE